MEHLADKERDFQELVETKTELKQEWILAYSLSNPSFYDILYIINTLKLINQKINW